MTFYLSFPHLPLAHSMTVYPFKERPITHTSSAHPGKSRNLGLWLCFTYLYFVTPWQNDDQIDPSHSVALFEYLLRPYLPERPLEDTLTEWEKLSTNATTAQKLREERQAVKDAEAKIVRVDQIADFGYLRSFQRSPSDPQHDAEQKDGGKDWGDVRHLEVTHGGHDRVQYSEVTLRCLRDIMSRSMTPERKKD
jgi:hypothetical protein